MPLTKGPFTKVIKGREKKENNHGFLVVIVSSLRTMTKSNLHHFLKAFVTGHYVKEDLDIDVVLLMSMKRIQLFKFGNDIMTWSPYFRCNNLFGFSCRKIPMTIKHSPFLDT